MKKPQRDINVIDLEDARNHGHPEHWPALMEFAKAIGRHVARQEYKRLTETQKKRTKPDAREHSGSANAVKEAMPRKRKQPTHLDVAAHLEEPKAQAEFLSARLENGSTGEIISAINTIITARGMTEIAKAAGIKREHLYQALADDKRAHALAVILRKAIRRQRRNRAGKGARTRT
ncbi:hypothetical protein [Bradyrhizobium sp. dw_78]|uniref:helix-turn-helix domain-containing transcriptional regulator n=1 Tax=Bradyrhizobium sp. dw_78 TaxID=2719793 RepID=UPI001BD1BEA9|nr:hypothetical protein [Bradyrhizobium sp. dw_78]